MACLVCRLLVPTSMACWALRVHIIWAAKAAIHWAYLFRWLWGLEPLLEPSNLELMCGRAGLLWGVVPSVVFFCKFAIVWASALGCLIKETDTSYSKREPGELLHTSAMGYWKVRESICSSLKESAGCVGKAFLPCCLVLLRDGGAVGLSVQIAPREASPA